MWEGGREAEFREWKRRLGGGVVGGGVVDPKGQI